MRKIIAALLAAALCLGLAGCGPAPEPAEPAEFALACYPSAGFHPITGTNRTNLNLAGLVYEGLFELDQEFQVHNVLCASYTVSEDGLTWSFRLRPGVTFSDGSALTAADVVSSLEAARTSALYSARFADIGAVSATADGGVTVTLTRANGNLPALLDIPIVREAGAVPLGTGPYVLTGAGESWSLTANPNWRQGPENLSLQSIPLRAIHEADELIRAFDTREVTLVSTDLTGTNSLGFSGSFDTVDYPTSTMLYVGFNTVSGPCASAAVRQALLRAFDRSSAVTARLSRHAQAAALPVSPVSPLYDAELAQSLAYDTGPGPGGGGFRLVPGGGAPHRRLRPHRPHHPRRGAELRRVQQCPGHQPAQRLPGRLRHGQDGGGGPALCPAGPGAALRGDLLQELVGADAVESALRPDPHPAEPVLPV